MAYSSLVVANAFLDLAKAENKDLTNMQVQKLVYIAHGYALALLDRPLTYHNVHAWQWGPVMPRLYKKLSKYGAGIVSEHIPCEEPSVEKDSEEYSVIKGVWQAYGDFTGAKLSGITHQPHTPWSVTWETAPYGIISEDVIREHYKGLVPHGK